MPVAITVGGVTYRTDELTLAEAVKVEKETGESWVTMNPFRSASTAQAILTVCLAREMGEDDARAQVQAMKIGEVLQCLEAVVEDTPDTYKDGIPLVEAEPQTNGSSGAQNGSAGPPKSSSSSPSAISTS